MQVIMLEPDKVAYLKEIGNDLASMQTEVEGYIEIIYPFEDSYVGLCCNEEGKINGLPLNRAIYNNDNKDEIIDIIAGKAFICDCSKDELQSLSPELTEKYLKKFYHPQFFVNFNGKIVGFPVPQKP